MIKKIRIDIFILFGFLFVVSVSNWRFRIENRYTEIYINELEKKVQSTVSLLQMANQNIEQANGAILYAKLHIGGNYDDIDFALDDLDLISTSTIK